jgi:hypothetical protein
MDDMSEPTQDVPAGSDEIPSADLPDSTDQPETQGADPVAAELGEDGEGDLAPEDLGPDDLSGDGSGRATGRDDGPTDLRTELPEND